MNKSLKYVFVALGSGLLACQPAWNQTTAPDEVKINWAKSEMISKSTPTLQVVVNPGIARGGKLNKPAFSALHSLGPDYVRYVPWLPYPKQAVAELKEPANGKTSWDFSHIDPTLDDFMKATEGHSVILNFSTIPAWMYKTSEPVSYPDDPNQVTWNYTQGTELRDPSMKEVADYFARLLSWYTQGGFTDEYGKRWESGHHYKIAYWELLNEIDFEHHWKPSEYARFYDIVSTAMRKVDPNLKFMAIAEAIPGHNPDMFEYFLNPAHHQAGVPLDYITYHFYATPTPYQTIHEWQYTFFDQASGFLNTVRYINEIKNHYSPSTKTDLDELGVILTEDEKENNHPGYVAKPEPAAYWNLAGALYAHLYIELTKLGIDVIGESQLVGYPSQFPSVSMINYNTGEPNPRFWVLKLLKDNLGPGDQLVETDLPNPDISAQAYQTSHGKMLLVLNKRESEQKISLPADAEGASVSFVAPSTGDHAPGEATVANHSLTLQPFEVAIVHWK